MLKEALGRRGLFKRIGAGALLIGTAPQEVAKMAGVGANMSLPIGPSTLGNAAQAVKATRIFTSAADFSMWRKEFGKARAREASAQVRDLDPDIAGFHLPLGAKLRMQRERNYSRIKSHLKANFLRSILRGAYHEWGDDGPVPSTGYGGVSQGRNY